MEHLTLPVTDGFLVGDYQPGTEFVCVWVHGFGSHRGGEKAAVVAAECERRGWGFARFDFRGHGESSGTLVEMTIPRLLADLDAICDYLRERGHDHIGLVGSSLGGLVSAWYSVQHPESVLGCVLIAPAFRFLDRRWGEIDEPTRAEWRRTGRRRIQNQWLDVEIGYPLVEDRDLFADDRLAAAWRTPVLLLHGWADTAVPVEESLRFFRSVEYADVELRLYKDGDHRLNLYKNEIALAVGSFFERCLAARRD